MARKVSNLSDRMGIFLLPTASIDISVFLRSYNHILHHVEQAVWLAPNFYICKDTEAAITRSQASFHMRLSGSSEQTGDPAVFVHVDLLGSGDLGQPRHGHDLARQGNDEARHRR